LDDSPPWGRLTRRAEFQRAGKGKRVNSAAFTLQAQARPLEGAKPPETAHGPRFGLTVTKKTGNSPARSRIKRRLREAMRRIAAQSAEPDFDYVLMARTAALHQSFDALVTDIQSALRRAHARRDGRP
jgi:ribonuclease P protein component